MVRVLHTPQLVMLSFWRATTVLLAFVVAACASAPPPSVVSVAPNGEFEWQRGRQVSQVTNRNVDFYVAFERDRGQYTEWWVRIVNRTGRDLLVSPARFYYRVADTAQGGRNVKALDPSVEIAELDVENAERASKIPVCTPYDAMDFVDDVASSMLGFETESPSEAKRSCELQRAVELTEQAHAEQWRELLANQTLRQSVLHPGDGIEGIVLFPRLEHRGQTELILITQGAVARLSYAASLQGGAAAERARPALLLSNASSTRRADPR